MSFWNRKKKENEPNLAEFDANFEKKSLNLKVRKNDDKVNLENFSTEAEGLNFNIPWRVENPFDEMIEKFEKGESIHLKNFEESPYRYSGSDELASLTFSKEGFYLELSEQTAIFTVNKRLGEAGYFSISMTYESFTSFWKSQIMVTEDTDQDGQVSFNDQNVDYPLSFLIENDFDLAKIKEFFNKIIIDEFLTEYFHATKSEYSLENLGNFIEIQEFEIVGVPKYFLSENYPDFTYDEPARNPFEEILQNYATRKGIKFDIFKEDYREDAELYLIQKRADGEFTQVVISPADVIFTVSKNGNTTTFDVDEQGKLYIIDKNFEDENYLKKSVSKFLDLYFLFNQSEFSMKNLGNCQIKLLTE